MAVVLILDEVRQMITDLLLPSSGPGTIWETPAERWRAGVALVRSMKHAAVVLAMDAQAGAPEQELLRGVGRVDAERVLGCPPATPTRVMRWTSQQSRWRDCLLGHAKARSATDKPLLLLERSRFQTVAIPEGCCPLPLRKPPGEQVTWNLCQAMDTGLLELPVGRDDDLRKLNGRYVLNHLKRHPDSPAFQTSWGIHALSICRSGKWQCFNRSPLTPSCRCLPEARQRQCAPSKREMRNA